MLSDTTFSPKISEKSGRAADSLSLLEQVAELAEPRKKTVLERLRSLTPRRCSNPKAPIIFGKHKNDGIALVHKSKCKMWNCPTCKARNAQRALAYLLNHINTVGGQWFFMTITPHEAAKKNGWSLQNLRKNWHKLRKRMRDKHGGHFDYFRVWEVFKDGQWHIHLITNCVLPYATKVRKDGTKKYRSGWLKDASRQSGMGYIADYQPLDNAGFAAHYVAKYLMKAVDDGVQWEKGQRRYQTSQGWTPLEDWSEESDFDWSYVEDSDELWFLTNEAKDAGFEIYISTAPQSKKMVHQVMDWWYTTRRERRQRDALIGWQRKAWYEKSWMKKHTVVQNV